MLEIKAVNASPFEDARAGLRNKSPELHFAVVSRRAVGFYESLRDYNDNAALWVAWFEGDRPDDLASFIRQEVDRAEASVSEAAS